MMDRMGMKQSSPDVLSKLPDNVIDGILMCLPFRDAVCTSILSKKWRYKWCRLPVTKFTLCIEYRESCPRINNLLDFLYVKGIQHLVLRLPRRSKMPFTLFKCLELRHLYLQNCLLVTPTSFKGFDRLISLELHDVTIYAKLLESVISRSLLLEKLVLNISDTLSDIIEIDAPMLRSCDFMGDMGTICLKHVPRLAKLSLTHFHKEWKKFDVVNFLTSNFFKSCSDLEHLHLNYRVPLATGEEIPTTLPLDVMCVKHLCMCICLDRDEILCALCLIRSFPFLRYLEIQMEDNVMNAMPALECLKVEAFPDVKFKYPRGVKLIKADGSMLEMQLIKLLLAKSPALLRMLINPHGLLKKSAIVKRLAKVTEFERASPKAEVIFKLL